MTKSAFYFPSATPILASPRRPLWVREFSGFDVGVGPAQAGARGFEFLTDAAMNAGDNPIAVGDRLTVERVRASDGVLDYWRGVVHSFAQPVIGGDGKYQNDVFITLDADTAWADAGFYLKKIEANRADRWRLIKPTGNIAPTQGRWHLFNRRDTDAVDGALLDGQLASRGRIDDLYLIFPYDRDLPSYPALALARAARAGVAVRKVAGGMLGGAQQVGESYGVFGAGGENVVATPSGANLITNIPVPARPLFGGADTVLAVEITAPNAALAAMLVLVDEMEVDTIYPVGWQPPLWRAFKQQVSVSEAGYLQRRYTVPQPAELDIPLRYMAHADVVGGRGDLVRKMQDENFFFRYNADADAPVWYGWLDEMVQPRYDSPTVLSANLRARGYYRY